MVIEMDQNIQKPSIRFKGFTDTWEQCKFKDIFVKLQNNSLSRADLNDDNGYAMNVHYGDVLIKFGEILDVQKESIPYISEPTIIEKYKNSFLQNGDIIIADAAEDNSVGKCCEIAGLSQEAVLSGLHTIPCRPLKKFASGYLGYYMNSNVYHDQLLPLIQGSKISSISINTLANTSLVYPKSIDEQLLIANKFRALDNLITLHQRKYDKLVNTKKALLDKMFPKAGESTPKLRFRGFTDTWEQCELSELAQITMGQSPNGINYTSNPEDNILVQGNADMQNGWVTPRVWTTQITKIAEPNDLIFSVRAPVGAVGKTKFMAVIGRGVASIRGNEFVFQELLRLNMNNHWKTISTGSTFDSINSAELKTTQVKAPQIDEQNKIGDFLKSVDTLITLHQRKYEKLKNIKKALLQKMFV